MSVCNLADEIWSLSEADLGEAKQGFREQVAL